MNLESMISLIVYKNSYFGRHLLPKKMYTVTVDIG